MSFVQKLLSIGVLVLIFIFIILNNLSFLQGVLLLGIGFLGLVLFWQPLWGLFLLIALRPAFDRLGTSVFPLGSHFEIEYHGLVGFLVFIWGSILVAKKLPLLKKSLPAYLVFILLIIFFFLSSFWSPVLFASFREFLRLGTIFLLYGAAFILIRTKKQFQLFLNSLLISSVIPLAIALKQFFQKQGGLQPLWLRKKRIPMKEKNIHTLLLAGLNLKR